MTFPLNATVAGIFMTCVAVGVPTIGAAQSVDQVPSGSFDQAPRGSFTFGNFGSANADALPLEIAPESPVQSAPRRVAAAELDVAPLPNGVETTRITSRTIQNTWTTGVFR